MNKKQLGNLGVIGVALDIGVRSLAEAGRGRFFQTHPAKSFIKEVVADPQSYVDHEFFGSFAKALLQQELEEIQPAAILPDPIEYPKWGTDFDENCLEQMNNVCRLPITRAAAILPDAHLGYSIPVGAVVATEDAVIPYGVGVDISCRMHASIILDVPVKTLQKDQRRFWHALEKGTIFGIGGTWKPRQNHSVMEDKSWDSTKLLKLLKDRAWSQLGTSGTGNHFAEFGILTFDKPDLGLQAGEYLCLLSHSGSRGAGANICNYYTDRAKSLLPVKYKKAEGFDIGLAWLGMKEGDGQEYWEAMTLMAKYAKANHEVIHAVVLDLLGSEEHIVIENSHNLAWKEEHGGKELIVHRKGATPAGKGILGIIPGSMADPGFIVRGKGNPKSLNSSSHGAGRRMSRSKARKEFNKQHWHGILRQRGVTLMSGGIDEMPGVYKSIEQVMAAQTDLVDIVARFDPKLVRMADDGKSED